MLDPKTGAAIASLVQKEAFVEAINDAWALMALITLAVLFIIPLARTPVWRVIVSIRKGRVFERRERASANIHH
jgi:hypothetical protein